MHAGNQPSAAREHAEETPIAEPGGNWTAVSRAAAIPCVVIAAHVFVLWWAPAEPSWLGRSLPWPLEALWVWLPWLSVVLSHIVHAANVPQNQRSSSRVIAALAFVFSLHYIGAFRLTAAREHWYPERYVSELAAHFSTTWHGAPVRAWAYSIGWGACCLLMGAIAKDTSARWDSGSLGLRRIGQGLAILTFMIGSSALLRYASGTPWPLFGTP